MSRIHLRSLVAALALFAALVCPTAVLAGQKMAGMGMKPGNFGGMMKPMGFSPAWKQNMGGMNGNMGMKAGWNGQMGMKGNTFGKPNFTGIK